MAATVRPGVDQKWTSCERFTRALMSMSRDLDKDHDKFSQRMPQLVKLMEESITTLVAHGVTTTPSAATAVPQVKSNLQSGSSSDGWKGMSGSKYRSPHNIDPRTVNWRDQGS